MHYKKTYLFLNLFLHMEWKNLSNQMKTLNMFMSLLPNVSLLQRPLLQVFYTLFFSIFLLNIKVLIS